MTIPSPPDQLAAGRRLRRHRLARFVWAAAAVAAAVAVSVSACSKSGGAPSAPTPTSAASTAPTPSESSLEQQEHAKVNEYRVSKGLASLAWNDTVAEQARQHSRNMAAGTVAFGHDGFSTRTSAIAQSVPWTTAAENVAMISSVSDPASEVFNNWLASQSHKVNIEGSFNLTGIGVAKASNGAIYFTQVFVQSK
jgi:uncharacterized protein YkwD